MARFLRLVRRSRRVLGPVLFEEGIQFADYRGLDVFAVNALRAKLRAAGSCEYRVVKNSILRRASEGTGAASIATCS